MLLVRGHGGGTALTGTIFERGEEPPTYRGAPNEAAPYVWVCDEFYQVESGGSETEIDGQSIRVAFDTPMPRGFDTREQALEAAKEHIRTQFARVGVSTDDVRIEVIRPDEEGQPEETA
ncbi:MULTISPECIES: hypothetical protein [Haloferax]|uniref:Uncharacterized protein n=1 Tax=Haloferax marinum TaxID=2666143 RepID=A0A6A8GA71_9EURY|nr:MULTISPECIES: hypothetical protein [Haloferax]KAB1198381.1 hypothetical protein Hfx1150_13005 [Haloferax sp. CBA1150]MRW97482.1 hypothetical protein [Haloferax marinum]